MTNHTLSDSSSAAMRAEISTFFRHFALQVLRQAQVDANDVVGFKRAMVDHYEEIYPRFSLTPVFRAHFQQEGHEAMVEEYKRCFGLLLLGRLP